MASLDHLEKALLNPHEDLSFEYKAWLDLNSNHDKATLAKAVIAMANGDGGYVVIGYDEIGDRLQSVQRPKSIRQITQDLVNGAIQRFVEPALHVRLEVVANSETGVDHPVVVVPSTSTTPVMAVRDCEGVLRQARVYVRQPGPRSEEPRTVEEWRSLLDRCVQRSRSKMLDAIRAIVEGKIEGGDATPNFERRLEAFVSASRNRHDALLDEANIPAGAAGRFPLGRYEISFGFEGAEPATNLNTLRERIDVAHQVKLTGWPAFVALTRPELSPYVSHGGIEAWVGRPGPERVLGDSAAFSDFWRIVPAGMLFTTNGYDEDCAPNHVEPGTAFDIALPIIDVGEALLFARRLASTFEGVETIAVNVRWSGLQGRTLTSMMSGRGRLFGKRTCRTSAVENRLSFAPEQIDDTLPEVVRALLAPLYEAFDFFEPPSPFIERELDRLMRRT